MIKQFIKRLILKEKYDSESYLKFIRSKGTLVGEDVTIYSPNKSLIDMTRPWLINIGNHVRITEGVTILTHGYDWSVLKGLYGDVLGSSGGGVSIGNNVFHWYALYNP